MEMNNWKGRSYSEVINDFIEFITTVKDSYYKDKNVDEEMLKKQNDLLHDLELEELSYHEIARLGKEIRQLRKNRREFKNEYLCIEPIKDFYKDFESQKFIQKLKALAENLDRNFERVQNQKYNYRSKLENISSMKKDDTSQESMVNNDIIHLNKLVKSIVKNSTYTVIKNDAEAPIISIDGKVDETFGIARAKSIINDIDKIIMKFFRPNNVPITTEHKSSDMLLTEKNYKYIMGKISIMCEDSELYKLWLKISCKNDEESSKKKKKKNTKKKRR